MNSSPSTAHCASSFASRHSLRPAVALGTAILAIDHLTWRERVAYLGFMMGSVEQTDCPLTHGFAPGLYTRTMRIPSGTVFLGRAHRYGHRVTLVKGTVRWLTERGTQIVQAPFTTVTQPGDCIVCVTVRDIIAVTSHPNPDDSRDVEALEADIFESYDAMRELGAQIASGMKAIT
jgi:hypothetical protein